MSSNARRPSEEAAAFYRHFGFMPSPTDSRHLYLPIKDIRAMAGA